MRVCGSLFLILVGCWGSLGCRTIETRRTLFRSEPLRTSQAVRKFSVEDQAGPKGYVVLFSSKTKPEEALYVVQNLHRQDLGVIDSLGRAYRYVPHEDEPAWLGSGSIPRGVQRILNTQEVPAMREVSLLQRSTEASFPTKREAASNSQIPH